MIILLTVTMTLASSFSVSLATKDRLQLNSTPETNLLCVCVFFPIAHLENSCGIDKINQKKQEERIF